jgi:hypothetical protein
MGHTGENKNTDMVLVEKPECEVPLGRPRCRWADNIKMDIKE